MTAVEAKLVWANIESDSQIFSGGQGIDWTVVLPEAERSSVLYTPGGGTRSLDILHVAIAMNFGARVFISFDHRQRDLAKSAGLNVLPITT